MREGFPVKKVLYLALGLIVFFSLGIFFIVTFTHAERDVGSMQAGLDSQYCLNACSELIGQAFNYNSCAEFLDKDSVITYVEDCVPVIGQCNVTVKSGRCVIK